MEKQRGREGTREKEKKGEAAGRCSNWFVSSLPALRVCVPAGERSRSAVPRRPPPGGFRSVCTGVFVAFLCALAGTRVGLRDRRHGHKGSLAAERGVRVRQCACVWLLHTVEVFIGL